MGLFPNPRKTLIERIEAAIDRIKNGNACMQIPAHEDDVDIVLAECRAEIERLRDIFKAVQAELNSAQRFHGDPAGREFHTYNAIKYTAQALAVESEQHE